MNNKVKMLPYGISSFEELREMDMYCVDKSMYLPKLERACDFLFLTRPRRFGKSIFLSMLRSYYDMESQDRFDTLFDGLWIKDNPTELKGKYQVMYFDFSQAASGEGDLKKQFFEYCSNELIKFAKKYAKYYDADFVENVTRKAPDSAIQLLYICGEAQLKRIPLYLILDEYDNFTNNVLSQEGQAVYHALTHATGFYRQIFKLYKPNFQRILMMGVSPVTLDDLTSGFNIAFNICMDPRFNMMLGFSETEVRQMIHYYKDAGMIAGDIDDIIAYMRPWYDNYCFSKECYGKDPTMFNCDMVIYYLQHYIKKGCPPENRLDNNTRTDYKKLKRLIELEGMRGDQRGLIHRIAAEGKITGIVNDSFPADRIYDGDNFTSLLYYYGMLTIMGSRGISLILGIPNNNVRKLYYEYLLDEYRSTTARIAINDIIDKYTDMAYSGQWRQALEMIANAYEDTSSVRSAIEGERNFQGFFCAYMSLNAYYMLAPEVEMAHGYCDIYLLPDKLRWPETAHSYIIELKYLAANDSKAEEEKQWRQATEQLRRYATDRKVALLSKDTTLHLIILQLRNYKLARLEEIER